jgi:hypothetical protein
VLLPAGAKIAFTGGLDFSDHPLIWDKLDQLRAKHPDAVLLHDGSPNGAERIAARWADHRKLPQIAFKPDWTKYAKAARNDLMLDVLPIGGPRFRRHRDSGEHGRHSAEARDSGLEIRQRRRVGATISPAGLQSSNRESGSIGRSTQSRFSDRFARNSDMGGAGVSTRCSVR